jgi:putative ABC transport system permease protein
MNKLHTVEEGISIAFDSIRANKVRSGLTILGVAVGVAVVVTIAGLITGIRSSIMEGFEAAGPDNFSVQRFAFSGVNLGDSRPPWFGKPRIEPEEAERLAQLPSVKEALYNFNFNITVDVEERSVSGVTAIGYSAGWPSYTAGEFVAGRDFIPQEVRQARPLVVITAALAEELFGQRDPIGRGIRISAGRRGVSERFEVVGVFEPEDNVFSAVVKHWAVFPYTSAMKRLKASNWQASVWIVPRDSIPQETALDEVIGSMRAMRGLRPREGNNFSVLPSDQLLESFNNFTGMFAVVMLGLSSAGLLVGGIGVVGIMMISVTERTREIGIRKAVGATRQEILLQFLVESAFLTAMGGGLGMAIGASAAFGVASFTPIPASIPLWSVAAALGMAIVTGVAFGLVPAFRASRLDPVTALRYE